MSCEAAIAVDIARVDCSDVGEQPLFVAHVVEPAAVVEEDTVKGIDGNELDVIAELAARELEELFDEVWRGVITVGPASNVKPSRLKTRARPPGWSSASSTVT